MFMPSGVAAAAGGGIRLEMTAGFSGSLVGYRHADGGGAVFGTIDSRIIKQYTLNGVFNVVNTDTLRFELNEASVPDTDAG